MLSDCVILSEEEAGCGEISIKVQKQIKKRGKHLVLIWICLQCKYFLFRAKFFLTLLLHFMTFSLAIIKVSGWYYGTIIKVICCGIMDR